MDEWPEIASLDENGLEKYLSILNKSEPTFSKEERANRNTTRSESSKFGPELEQKLSDRYEFLAVPENNKERDYDALIPIESEEGIKIMEVQIKGCFHSKKSNPNTNGRLVIPYDTHNSNGDDYLYHLGTYSAKEGIDDMEVVNEATLNYDEMDALLQYSKWTDPNLVVVDESRGRLRAQIDWEVALEYAETVHRERENSELNKTDLYRIAEDTLLNHSEQEEYFEIDSSDLSPKKLQVDEEQMQIREF